MKRFTKNAASTPAKMGYDIDAEIGIAEAKLSALESEFEERFGPEALADAALLGSPINAGERNKLQAEIDLARSSISGLHARRVQAEADKRKAKIAGLQAQRDELVAKRAATDREERATWQRHVDLEAELRSLATQIGQYDRTIKDLTK